jgi:hypothetical protein
MPVTADVLRKYPNPAFIETGAYEGDGVQAALSAGFEIVCTIELLTERARNVLRRFHGCPVRVLLGDSAEILPWVLRDVPRATVWLDAHDSTGEILTGDKYPLKRELECLVGTRHTILIDDVRLFPLYGLSIEGIRAMFPERHIHFENGCQPDDIMVLEP